jgi:O-antigen/teichoic acid export membrane protein
MTAFLLLTGLNLAGALLVFPLAPFLWQHALSSAGSPALIRIAAASFVLDACVSVPMLLMQARQRAALFAAATLGKLLLSLSLNILFVVGLGKGVLGILVANLIANAVVGVLLAGWMLRTTGLRPSLAAARDLRRFGVPYQLVTAGTFILTFGDRAFLQAFHGLAAVGVYGLAYQFGFLLISVTSAPFFRAWAPQRMQIAALEPKSLRDAHYNRAFRWLNLLLIGAAVGISLYAWPVLAVLSGPAYRGAAQLVPVILVAFVVQVWTDVVALGIEVSERTWYAWRGAALGAAAILLFYALLIPPFAGAGAAVATVLGFLVRFALFYRFSQRAWPVAWRFEQPIRLAGIGALTVAAVAIRPPTGYLSQLGFASAAFLAFWLAAWWFVLSNEERSVVGGLARTPRRALAEMISA